MSAFKLTDPDGYTRRGQTGETLWAPGRTVTPAGVGTMPGGPGVLHAYLSPDVAVLGDPIHARLLPGGRCFVVDLVGGGRWETDGLKRWTTSPLQVLEEVPVPALSLLERVAWVIVIAPHPCTCEWAIGWLTGRDRSLGAAYTASEAAAAAAAPSRDTRWRRRRGHPTVVAALALAAAAEAASLAAYAAAYAATARTAAEAYAATAPAASAASLAAQVAASAAEAESRLMPALARARAILAGSMPAERYDEP